MKTEKEKMSNIDLKWNILWKTNYNRDDLIEQDIKGFTEFFFYQGVEAGKAEAIKQIRDWIINEREHGNLFGEKGFSAGLCLSNLLTQLERGELAK